LAEEREWAENTGWDVERIVRARGKAFALRPSWVTGKFAADNVKAEVYSLDEIARAVGVSRSDVLALGPGRFVPHSDAVRIGRELVRIRGGSRLLPRPIFWIFAPADSAVRPNRVPLIVSSALHAAAIAAFMFVAALSLAPSAATLKVDDRRPEPIRLVFTAEPGPGGGGGGGGLLQPAPAPKAMRAGHHAISSPLPVREAPKPIVPTPAPPEPKPLTVRAEQLPPVVAPVVSAPADLRDRAGVMEQSTADGDSHGPGRGGGAGTGTGTGLGAGDGSGIGPGSGGGTGGGPYRPGSGIEPPRLLREVKADYTEDARRAGVEGDVVLEIVVRSDGSVGDVTIKKGLGQGLNERAVQAVRQWRFSPAHRKGAPVDVIVEVSVEFKLR
jgi:TonB family protein